jgi:arylsulfatase A-like enzyme
VKINKFNQIIFCIALFCLRGTVLADQRPNIIFLLTDDQRWNAGGYMGNTEIKTPNLDQLAADGMVFENHFNTTSICMPSRATIMTGKYEFITGVTFGRGNMKPEDWSRTYPMLLKRAGYYTGFAGKLGFDVDFPGAVKGDKYSLLPVKDFDGWGGWPQQGNYRTEKNQYVAKYAEKYPHVTRALGAFSQDFIKTAAKQDKPFCLSISFKAPHGPQQADPAFDDLYDEGVIFSKPENYGMETGATRAPQSALGRQRVKSWLNYNTEERFQKFVNIYYRQIYGVDVAVGMIREELERLGLADNTIVIFTSDNGFFLGSHAFGGKTLPYEDGTHVPMIVYDPRNGSSHGKRTKAVTSGIDIAPTILTYAGAAIPAEMNGEMLQPIMNNPKARVRDQLLQIQVWSNTRDDVIGALGVVTEKYRYSYWYYANEEMAPTEELYDRINDRWERRNLAANPEHKETLETMRTFYDSNLEMWKELRIGEYGYDSYDRIADRNIPWQEKEFVEPRPKRNVPKKNQKKK